MKRTIQQQQLEKVCSDMIKSFNGDCENMESVDIDSFVTEKLGYSIEYESFAEENKLGFTSDGITPLEVIRDGVNYRVVFPARTIVIEKFYQDKKHDVQRRFILAHEVGHIIQNIFEGTALSGFYSDFSEGNIGSSFLDIKTGMSVVEAKANKYAAAILMPDFVIFNLINKYHNGKKFLLYNKVLFSPRDRKCIEKIAGILKVSYSALFYRLKELGAYMERNDDSYVKKMVLKEIQSGNKSE